MLRPIHLYLLRTLSLVANLVVASIPLWQSQSVLSSLLFYPLLMIATMLLFAFAEQRLLHNINWQQVATFKPHKAKFKPVKAHKHAGCKLLGLACPA